MIDINLNIPIDTTPTNGSANLIDSNAVFDGLATKENSLPSIVGNSLKVLQVNASETAKEWATIPSGITIGTTPITSGVAGRVLFEGAGNVVQEDSGLFWDNTNKRLGIGTTAPDYSLHIIRDATSNYIQLSGNSNKGLFATGAGLLAFDTSGNFRIYTGGVNERIIVDSTGNVGIGTLSPTSKLQVKAQGALSTDIALRVRNSADTSNLFMVKGNGVLNAANLPTSATGLVAGDIWNNLGILTIV